MKTAELTLARGLALIFDLDGVVVDSMPAHTLAWQRYLERLGIPREDVSVRMHGRRNDEIVRDFLGEGVPAEVVFEHGAAKERLFREMMAPQLTDRLVPGVARFLERAAAAPEPFPVALATNAEPANVSFVLQGTGLGRWFQVVANGTHVKRPKPAPHIYLYAAERLNMEPENCIVFEDSPVGIAAARAAGMRVAGVQTHAEALENVDIAVRDFLDPELERWLSTQQVS
jgi:HAD superfamily hydrolase (TIGR01509 family)